MKIILVSVLAAAFLLTNAQNIWAHTLKTDGSIGAVLHINPNDEPVAKQESDIYFEIKDTENKFKASDCNCQVVIKEDGNVLFDQPILGSSEPSLNSPTISFSFPEKGIYRISLAGKPKEKGAFQNFDLSWNIRVEGGQNQNPFLSNYLSSFAIGFLILVLVTFAFSNYRKGKN